MTVVRFFVIVFGVVIVLVLLKYWDQSLIEKSMLSSYQKIKSKFSYGVGQDIIYVTNEKFNKENQALRKEISWLNMIVIKNISHIMEKLQNPTVVEVKNPAKNVKKEEKSVAL